MISEREENDAIAEARRKMTYGQKAVGLTFNPSRDPRVQKLKELYAAIIDICNEGRDMANVPEDAIAPKRSPETMRLFSIAITQAQNAQMWSVKACTWVD